ncbi:MAG: tyrosine-type recombinase/integrase [Candidatus Bathyarchaeota archaeon]|nr:tyrosine-type recombinase/integrase [Candidatus Bathyarchaeota archaeon]
MVTTRMSAKQLKNTRGRAGVSIHIKWPDWLRLITCCLNGEADSQPLTAEEVRKVLDIGNLQQKAIVSILAFGGVRDGSIEHLTYGDLKEDFESGKLPCKLRAFDDKKNKRYATFLNKEAVEIIRAYLNERAQGTKKIEPEKIDDNSPLIRVVHKGKGPEVSAADKNTIYVYVSRLLKDAGINGLAKPHSFRKYFHQSMLRGGCPESWANLLAGRVAEQGAGKFYNLKPLENPADLEEIRAKYAEGSRGFFPRTEVEQAMNGMNKELEELKAENQKLRRELEDTTVKKQELASELEAQKRAVLYQTTEITKKMIAEEARKLVEELIKKRLG